MGTTSPKPASGVESQTLENYTFNVTFEAEKESSINRDTRVFNRVKKNPQKDIPVLQQPEAPTPLQGEFYTLPQVMLYLVAIN